MTDAVADRARSGAGEAQRALYPVQGIDYTQFVRVYLDVCCLKRPFDAQDQVLVRLETEAVMTILSVPAGRIAHIRAPAHVLENSLNPLRWRREAVGAWLSRGPIAEFSEGPLTGRVDELIGLGFKSFDALHLASAEAATADAFLTVDGRLRKKAETLAAQLHVRVTSPLVLVEEVFQ